MELHLSSVICPIGSPNCSSQNFVFFKDQTSYTTQFWFILHRGLHPLDQLDPCSMIWFLWSCIGGYHSYVFRSPCISTGIGSIPSALGHQCWCGVSPCILWLGCHWRQSWGHEWLWAPCLGSSGRCHTLPGFSVVSLWRVLHWLVWSPRSCCPWSGQNFLSSSFFRAICLSWLLPWSQMLLCQSYISLLIFGLLLKNCLGCMSNFL